MFETGSAEFWGAVYRKGQTAWDLGGPTPVFQALAGTGEFPPGKMIVLGAGRGYDARLFARHGFDVTAVDFAAEAVEEMDRLSEPDAPVEVLQADLLALDPALDGRFDYVLEYVCFCAIDPERREDYAETVARLLGPGGVYIALAYPIGDYEGGPPFAVDPDELVGLLERRGFELLRREFRTESVERRRGQEELVVMKRG
jgi:SAM-dependent methyltransferase